MNENNNNLGGIGTKIVRIGRRSVRKKYEIEVERYIGSIHYNSKNSQKSLIFTSYTGHIARLDFKEDEGYTVSKGGEKHTKPVNLVTYKKQDLEFLIYRDFDRKSTIHFFDNTGNSGVPKSMRIDLKSGGALLSGKYQLVIIGHFIEDNLLYIWMKSGSVYSADLKDIDNNRGHIQVVNLSLLVDDQSGNFRTVHKLKSNPKLFVMAQTNLQIFDIETVSVVQEFSNCHRHVITKMDSFFSSKFSSLQPEEIIVSASERGSYLRLWNLRGDLLGKFDVFRCFDIYVGKNYLFAGSSEGSFLSFDESGVNLVRRDFKRRSRISFFKVDDGGDEESFGVYSMDEKKIIILDAGMDRVEMEDMKERSSFLHRYVLREESFVSGSVVKIVLCDSVYSQKIEILCNKSFF